MVKLELTVEEFNAIINLLATIPANNSYYIIKHLKELGDSQVEEILAARELQKTEEAQATTV